MSWSEGQIVGLGSCKPFRQTSKVFEQKVSNLTALMKQIGDFLFWTLCPYCFFFHFRIVHLHVCASIKGFMLQCCECYVSCVALKSADYICTDLKHLVCERTSLL